MHSSQLLSILKLLSSEEIKDFSRWIESPFFNSNQSLVKLFSYLRKYYPEFNSKKLEKEKIFEHLFGKKKYADQTIRFLFADLTKQLNGFLANQYLNENPLFEKEFLLHQLNQRGAVKMMNKQLKEYETAILSQEKYDSTYTYHKLIHQVKLFEYQLLFHRGDVESLFKNMNINNLEKAAKEYYYQTLLSNYLTYFHLHYSFKLSKSIDYVATFLETIKPEIQNTNPALQFIYAVVRLAIYNTDIEFENLRNFMKQFEDKLKILELRDGYVSVSNYCVRQIRKGRIEFSRIKFEIDKIVIEKGLRNEDKFINGLYFINVLRNAIWLKELSWVENALKDYKLKVHPDFHEPNYDILKAELFLYKGQFVESLSILNMVKFSNASTQRMIKQLAIMNYFELDEYELFENGIANFKYSLRKDSEMTKERKMSFVFFIDVLNKLNKLRMQPDLANLQKINTEIKTAESVLRKEWLLEKVKELENKFSRKK